MNLPPGEYTLREIERGRYKNKFKKIPDDYIVQGDKLKFTYYGKYMFDEIQAYTTLKAPANILGDLHMIVNIMDFTPE